MGSTWVKRLNCASAACELAERLVLVSGDGIAAAVGERGDGAERVEEVVVAAAAVTHREQQAAVIAGVGGAVLADEAGAAGGELRRAGADPTRLSSPVPV